MQTIIKNSFWVFALLAAEAVVSCSEDSNDIVDNGKESLPVIPPVLTDDVLFSCDFQGDADMDMFLTYDLDQLTPSSLMNSLGFRKGTAWLGEFRDTYTSENCFAGATSNYVPAGKADDWLVLKDPINVPSEGYVLLWKSQSLDLVKKDGLNIYISTEGNVAPTNFSAQPVFTIEEEDAGKTENTDGEWINHSISLDDYVGKDIWFAFANQSEDKMMICLDEIEIRKRTQITFESKTVRMTTSGNLEIKGVITAKENTVNNFKAYYLTASGDSFGEEFKDLSVAPGQSYEFSISKHMNAGDDIGSFVPYQFWVEANGATVLIKDSVAVVPFEPIHKVVIEEGTGQWCGYCPLGILAFEYLLPKYKEQLIAIAVHNNDVMTVAEYDKGLGFQAFPNGKVNRKATCSPTTASYEFEGSGTFHDGLVKELAIIPEAEVRLTNASMNADIISLKSETRFLLNPTSNNYRLAYVVISNGYKAAGAQVNNLYSTSKYETFGKFGLGGEYGQPYVENLLYDEVACGIFPSFNGAEGIIPDQPVLNEVYTHDFEIDLKSGKNINSDVELELIVMLINGKDGSIVNADKVKL